MNKSVITLAALSALVGGCVSASPVVEVSENRYFVTAKDTGGVFSKDGKVVGEATESARQYCQQLGKKAVIEDIERDPEGPFRFETTDVYFSCED